MGTSSSYGGSNSKEWRGARESFEALGADDTGGFAGGDDSADSASNDSTAATAAAAIASALLKDDPEARNPNLTFSISGIANDRGSHGGGQGGGASSGPNQTAARGGARSTRHVAGGAARAAAAISGAYALRSGDSERLRELGLNLQELRSLSPKEQCTRILDTILGDAGHPDDTALKRATVEQLKAILTAETPPGPEETVRGFVAEWIYQIALVELLAARQLKNLSAQSIQNAEKQLKVWLKQMVRGLSFPDGVATVNQFSDATAKITAQALMLIKAIR